MFPSTAFGGPQVLPLQPNQSQAFFPPHQPQPIFPQAAITPQQDLDKLRRLRDDIVNGLHPFYRVPRPNDLEHQQAQVLQNDELRRGSLAARLQAEKEGYARTSGTLMREAVEEEDDTDVDGAEIEEAPPLQPSPPHHFEYEDDSDPEQLIVSQVPSPLAQPPRNRGQQSLEVLVISDDEPSPILLDRSPSPLLNTTPSSQNVRKRNHTRFDFDGNASTLVPNAPHHLNSTLPGVVPTNSAQLNGKDTRSSVGSSTQVSAKKSKALKKAAAKEATEQQKVKKETRGERKDREARDLVERKARLRVEGPDDEEKERMKRAIEIQQARVEGAARPRIAGAQGQTTKNEARLLKGKAKKQAKILARQAAPMARATSKSVSQASRPTAVDSARGFLTSHPPQNYHGAREDSSPGFRYDTVPRGLPLSPPRGPPLSSSSASYRPPHAARARTPSPPYLPQTGQSLPYIPSDHDDHSARTTAPIVASAKRPGSPILSNAKRTRDDPGPSGRALNHQNNPAARPPQPQGPNSARPQFFSGPPQPYPGESAPSFPRLPAPGYQQRRENNRDFGGGFGPPPPLPQAPYRRSPEHVALPPRDHYEYDQHPEFDRTRAHYDDVSRGPPPRSPPRAGPRSSSFSNYYPQPPTATRPLSPPYRPMDDQRHPFGLPPPGGGSYDDRYLAAGPPPLPRYEFDRPGPAGDPYLAGAAPRSPPGRAPYPPYGGPPPAGPRGRLVGSKEGG
ncbi:hypothetical protein P7C70_g8714, partial [Phenoliferia sp. Uapishka_3]